MSPPDRKPKMPRAFTGAVAASAVGGLIVAGLLWLLGRLSEDSAPAPEAAPVTAPTAPVATSAATTAAPTSTTERVPGPMDPTVEVIGGCDRFAVYSQGRWPPPGAAVRVDPFPSAPQIGSRQPNVLISVDAWVKTEAPYPDNEEPWDSDAWFHLTGDDGWVSFARVRAAESHAGDTDGPHGGGQPVELRPECEGELLGR